MDLEFFFAWLVPVSVVLLLMYLAVVIIFRTGQNWREAALAPEILLVPILAAILLVVLAYALHP